MNSRGTVRSIASLLLGALLFAQAALAVAACDWLRVAPAQAIMAKAGEPSCHDVPAQNTNLCLSHCLGNDQSADTPQVVLPARVDFAPITIVATDRRIARAVEVQFVLPWPSVPPPRILFQTFLI